MSTTVHKDQSELLRYAVSRARAWRPGGRYPTMITTEPIKINNR